MECARMRPRLRSRLDPASPLSRVPQLKVLPRDLQLCSETASGVDVGGQHEWGELVQLDPQTVGVIVRLERETFQVCVLHSVAGLPCKGLPLPWTPHRGRWWSLVAKNADCSGRQIRLCQPGLALCCWASGTSFTFSVCVS